MPFPNQRNEVQEIVDAHVETLDQDHLPLALALYYNAGDGQTAEYVFEVAHGFGGDEVSGTGEMMQVDFAPAAEFDLNGSKLRLTLTNPAECEYAFNHQWPEVKVVLDAIAKKQCEVVYHRQQDMDADRLAILLGV